MDVGTKYRELLKAYRNGSRIVANKGGARSTKTWNTLVLLRQIAKNAQRPTLISVVSESLPHLKRGAMRDFSRILDICEEVEGKDYDVNRSDHVIDYGNGKIEFFGADNAGKVHGAQRDLLFVNECNHIPYETYRQLAVRTGGTIFLDWNPTHRFWFEDKVAGRDGVTLIHSTYKDNPFLSAEQVAEIESNRSDKNWWRVYGLGETGSVEGLVFSDWETCEEMPSNAKRTMIGVDFGFTHDPTAVLRVALSGGDLWIDELCYRKGMDNIMIARLLKDNGCDRWSEIVCDSAEPKSIAEINAFGFAALPVRKTPDSILNGLQILQRYRLHVTKRSTGLIDELRNYQWRQDTDGNWLNKPIAMYDHAIDALRYVALTYFAAKPTYRTRAKVATM